MEMISNGFGGIVNGMENGDEDNLKVGGRSVNQSKMGV